MDLWLKRNTLQKVRMLKQYLFAGSEDVIQLEIAVISYLFLLKGITKKIVASNIVTSRITVWFRLFHLDLLKTNDFSKLLL